MESTSHHPPGLDSRERPPLRIFLDFDGTLVEPNVAVVLVERFAQDGARVAREVDDQLHRGEITLRQAWERQAALLAWSDITAMTEFVRREVPLRKGAREFVELVTSRRIPLLVLSGGLDFYIRAILDREGFDLPYFSDTAESGPDGRLQVRHPFGHPDCRRCGICKAQVILRRLPDASRTVFIGDGSTDRFAAEVADVVFARRRLLDYCRQRGVPCLAFEDFYPVIEHLREWLDSGDALSPPRVRGVTDSLCPISRELSTIPAPIEGPTASEDPV
jgi:2,3-diketo-5-methylthio-1-phosphopentane phosphatase